MQIDQTWYQNYEALPVRVVAGGIVVRQENGRVLVALCGEHQKADYILPKGGIEKGETHEEAARREIEEEAGFTELQLLCELGSVGRKNFKKSVWSKCTYFLFYTTQSDVEPTEHKRHIKPRWFPIDQLPPIFWPEQHDLIADNRERIIDLVHEHCGV